MEVITLQSEAFQSLVNSINEIKSQISNHSSQALNNQWLDIPETCKFLKVSTRTLQNYRDRGIIPFSQFQDKIYFKVSDLEAHLNKHYVPAFKK